MMPDREKYIDIFKQIVKAKKKYHRHDDVPIRISYQCVVDILYLLKEQEAVKPVLDEQTGRILLCGKCGTYVGFEDNDPHDPNEFDKYCRECGTPVLWEGR